LKILITGAAGFIGSKLTEALIRRGDEIVCIDNFNDFYDPQIKRKNIEPFLDTKAFELVGGDIRNLELVDDVFKKTEPEAVVHLAAMAGVRPSLEAPNIYFDVNVTGSLNILQSIRKYGKPKLCFASSSSVYGGNKKVPFSEEDDVSRPVSPYAASKRAAEIMCYTFHHLYDLPIHCHRFFTVYGPGQRPEMAIHKFVRRILLGKPLPMFGDGGSKRDYTYIDDILDGVIKSLDQCEGYRIYNFGESSTISLADLITLIEKTIGKKAQIERHDDQPGDVPITFADITRAKEELGYDPKVSVVEGLKRFFDWYKEMKLPGGEIV